MMADIFTTDGLVDAGKRAVRTFAQTLSGSLIVFTGIMDVDWTASLGAAGLAALLALLQRVGDDAGVTGGVRAR